jgi:hypothetical protein
MNFVTLSAERIAKFLHPWDLLIPLYLACALLALSLAPPRQQCG